MTNPALTRIREHALKTISVLTEKLALVEPDEKEDAFILCQGLTFLDKNLKITNSVEKSGVFMSYDLERLLIPHGFKSVKINDSIKKYTCNNQ